MAAVVLTVAVNELWLGYRSSALTAAYVVPGLVALFLVTIAADIVASDVATRRIETFALLPARPILMWTAKLVFLLTAGLVFLGWTAAVVPM